MLVEFDRIESLLMFDNISFRARRAAKKSANVLTDVLDHSRVQNHKMCLLIFSPAVDHVPCERCDMTRRHPLIAQTFNSLLNHDLQLMIKKFSHRLAFLCKCDLIAKREFY